MRHAPCLTLSVGKAFASSLSLACRSTVEPYEENKEDTKVA